MTHSMFIILATSGSNCRCNITFAKLRVYCDRKKVFLDRPQDPILTKQLLVVIYANIGVIYANKSATLAKFFTACDNFCVTYNKTVFNRRMS